MTLYKETGQKELNNYRVELESLASQMQVLLENTGVGIYLVQNGDFVYVNPFFEELTGYKLEDIEGNKSFELIHADDREFVRSMAVASLKGEISQRPYEYRLIKKDGNPMWVLERISPIEYMGASAVIGSFVDIHERKQLEQALVSSEERYRSILETMQDAYYEVNLEGNCIYANESACLTMGYPMDELIGMNFHKVIAEDEIEHVIKVFEELIRTGNPNKRIEHKVVRKDGTIVYAEAAISLLKDKQEQIIGYMIVSRDVTERKILEKQLIDMATKDFLTGLPNRTLLKDRFQVAEAQAKRNNHNVAIMSLDLDEFKAVNDSLGHHVGDELLKDVAARLKAAMRSTDTVARIGGDEFLLLIPEMRHREDADGIASKIMACFATPFKAAGNDLMISTSLGISMYPEDGTNLEVLMKKSDAAMYQAKNSGHNQFKLYCDCIC